VPRSGATFNPSFEWREAARWARYTWEEFEALDGEQQSAVVAHFRSSRLLEAVIANEEARANRQRGRRRR
jgi:hypothetical protein